ncbi:LuxR C-terminal-related transcriptional regulator [Pseudomonas aeruginosa]|nr:LuxR C-terminal-related transcriptional regulator [Pseudomonas aeruginosa]
MGLTLTEIALKRNRSIKTISAQKSHAMRKLNAENDQILLIPTVFRQGCLSKYR